MNTVSFIGRLGKTPELRHSSSGKAFCTLSVAVDRAGNRPQESGWFPVLCWTRLAENVVQYLSKGSRVAVTGRLQQRTWQTDSGDNRSSIEIVAYSVDFLDPKGSQGESRPADSAGGSEPQEAAGDSSPPVSNDDQEQDDPFGD